MKYEGAAIRTGLPLICTHTPTRPISSWPDRALRIGDMKKPVHLLCGGILYILSFPTSFSFFSKHGGGEGMLRKNEIAAPFGLVMDARIILSLLLGFLDSPHFSWKSKKYRLGGIFKNKIGFSGIQTVAVYPIFSGIDHVTEGWGE